MKGTFKKNYSKAMTYFITIFYLYTLLLTSQIKSQQCSERTLDNIVYFGDINSYIIGATSDSKIAILGTTTYSGEKTNERYYCILKTQDNYPFDNGNFQKTCITSISDIDYKREANVLLLLQINGIEYILNCGDIYCEFTDYVNNIVNSFSFLTFFGARALSERPSILKLNDKKYTLSSTVIKVSNKNYLQISKFFFPEADIDLIEVYKSDYSLLPVIYNDMTSCFQTENNIIECLYIDPLETKYFLVLFDEDLNIKEKLPLHSVEASSEFLLFNACIHLKKEIGACLYFISPTKPPILKISNLIFNGEHYELVDLINNGISITLNEDKNTIDHNVDTNINENYDLKKITDNRFIYIYITKRNENVLVLVLFDLYGNNFQNLKIRYFTICLTIYDISPAYGTRLFLIGDLVGVTFCNIKKSDNSKNYALYIIFGNMNAEDPEKIFDLNNNNPDYILKPKDYFNNIIIENNIFGYEYNGAKTISLPDSSNGIKFLLISNNQEIKINDIITKDDEIKFDYNNINISPTDEIVIELAMIISEPSYSKFDEISDVKEFYGREDQINYYSPKTFYGKSTKFKFSFGCYENCETCSKIGISLDNQKCLTCKDPYYLDSTTNNCINDCVEIHYYNYKVFSNNKTMICLKHCLEGTCVIESNGDGKCVEKPNDLKVVGDKCTSKEDDITPILEEMVKNERSEENLIEVKSYSSKDDIDLLIDKNKNSTIIDLKECFNLLTTYYELKRNEELYVVVIDLPKKYPNEVTNKFDYEIYLDRNGEVKHIDPSEICQNSIMKVSTPINDFQAIHYDKAVYFKENGNYDIYNRSSEFYNDPCIVGVIDKNDIILDDRVADIYPHNVSLCPNNCVYSGVNLESKRFDCNCSTNINTDYEMKKDNETLHLRDFSNALNYFLDMINYKIIKCYYLFFISKNFNKNIGFYLALCLFISLMILALIYGIYGFSKLVMILYKDYKISINPPLSNKEIEIPKSLKEEIKEDIKENVKEEIKEDIKENVKEEIKEDILNDVKIGSQKDIKEYIKNDIKNDAEIESLKKKPKFTKNSLDIMTTQLTNQELLALNDGVCGQNQKMSDVFSRYNNSPRKKKKKIKATKQINVVITSFNINEENKQDKEKQNINEKKIKEEMDLNELTFMEAQKRDKRNFLKMFISFLFVKIEIIRTLFFPEKFTDIFLSLNLFLFTITLDLVENCLLFNDYSISEKYHKNGKISFVTSLIMSLLSIIFTAIIFGLIGILTNHSKLMELLFYEIHNEEKYFDLSVKVINLIKRKYVLLVFIEILIGLFTIYYLFIFNVIFHESMLSFLYDFSLSEIESLIISIISALLISLFRWMGIKKRNSSLYNTSKYLAEKL